jgi:hypothetical protein
MEHELGGDGRQPNIARCPGVSVVKWEVVSPIGQSHSGSRVAARRSFPRLDFLDLQGIELQVPLICAGDLEPPNKDHFDGI